MASSSLARTIVGHSSLTSSQRVAQHLEWNPNKLLLTMVIRRRNVSMAMAGPSVSVERLPSILLEPTQERQCSFDTILQHCDPAAVCGIVVEWPVTKHGVVGAECGRVLHTLESMKIRPSIPICLHSVTPPTEQEDAWGRLPRYGRPAPSHKTTHIASLEQYGDTNYTPCVVQDVWRTYAMRHWPSPHVGLYHYHQEPVIVSTPQLSIPPIDTKNRPLNGNLLHYVP